MLKQAQVEQYCNDGYTICPGFLSIEQVQAALAQLDRICAGYTLAEHDPDRVEMEPDQPDDGRQVRRLYDPCTHYPLFYDLAQSQPLSQSLEQLIGPDIFFSASKVNMKPGKIGSVVRWHQDFAYGPMTNTDCLSVLFYLDDTTRNNGCLQVLPAAHTLPMMDHTHDGYFQGQITEPVDESNAVALEGQAGTAIFLHCMTPHSSAANQSSCARRTLISMYRAADAYPIYCGPMSLGAEKVERLVLGRRQSVARFNLTQVPIPRYQQGQASLYQLQERATVQ